MQFKNLTPFDAMAYSAIDVGDEEHHIVAMAVGYRLERSEHGWTAHLIEDTPLPLCLADEHWGDPVSTSPARESDLVPFKPRCDVTVRGHAHAPGGRAARQWTAHLWLTVRPSYTVSEPEPPAPLNPRMALTESQRQMEMAQRLAWQRAQAEAQARPPKTVLDKKLSIFGPSHYSKRPLLGWRRSRIHPTTSVPLRWENSFGGQSRVIKCIAIPARNREAGGPEFEERTLLNEVCFSNPFGCGWVHKGWWSALGKAKLARPKHLPAPQVMAWGSKPPSVPKLFKHPKGEQDARAMQKIAARYGITPDNFAVRGKAWAPRLVLAGTYDEQWLETRHPGLPKDFNMAFWNGAPADQQIDFPDPTQNLTLHTAGLLPGGEAMSLALPPHRAFALIRFEDGVVLPFPMAVDLIELDTGDSETVPTLRVVWRTSVPRALKVRVAEARFEMDPKAPLLKLLPSADYQAPQRSELEAAHG